MILNKLYQDVKFCETAQLRSHPKLNNKQSKLSRNSSEDSRLKGGDRVSLNLPAYVVAIGRADIG